MATEVVKIVDTGGSGDYSSLAAWEADFGSCTQSNYPSMSGDGDLVGADLIAVADCRCSTGDEDDSAVTIDGWTSVDSDHYIRIWTDPDQGYRHPGKWDDTKYRLVLSEGTIFDIQEEYVRLIGLQMKGTRSTGSQLLIHTYYTSRYLRVEKCILCRENAGGTVNTGIGCDNSAVQIYLVNNLFYDIPQYAIRGNDYYYLYNNTIINCGTGVDGGSSGYCRAINNIVDCTTCFVGVFDSDSDFNISSDDTAPGPNSIHNATVTFVDAANGDFHLDASDTVARDAGTDLSSDPYLAFTDDIDGETRSAPWDIGVDEYVSGGGGVLTAIADILLASLTPATSFSVLRSISASLSSLSTTSLSHLGLLLTLTSNIQPSSSTDEIILSLTKLAMVGVSSQSTTADSDLVILRSLLSNVLPVSDSSIFHLDILRNALTQSQVGTFTPSGALSVLRRVTSSEPIQSYASTTALRVLRNLTSSLQAQSFTSALIHLHVVRELLANIPLQSDASDEVILSLAELFTAIANIVTGTSTNTPRLLVLRSLVTSASVLTDSNSVVLRLLKRVFTYVLSHTVTSPTTLNVLRIALNSITAQSSTPDDAELLLAQLITAVSNILALVIPSTTSLAIKRALVSHIQTTTGTGDVPLELLREVLVNILSQASGSTAPLRVLRPVSSATSVQTLAADDVVLLLVEVLIAAANVVTTVTTSEVSSNVLRELLTLTEVKTTSSDSVELSIAALIKAAADVVSQVLTGNAKFSILRLISTEVQTQTASHAVVLELIRSVTSAIQAAVTSSNSVGLIIVKVGQVEIVVTAQVAQAALAILKALAIDITSNTITADVLLRVLRSTSLGVDSTTLTGAVELITTMLGLIVDTTIESLTPRRTIEEV